MISEHIFWRYFLTSSMNGYSNIFLMIDTYNKASFKKVMFIKIVLFNFKLSEIVKTYDQKC